MTDFIKTKIFEMLLSGALLIQYGFFILEVDNHPAELEDAFPDMYYLIGLKKNDAQNDIKGKDFSPWVYETAYTSDYASDDWQDSLVNKFMESVSEKDRDDIIRFAYDFSWNSNNYYNYNHCCYGSTTKTHNPFSCKL